MVRLGVMLVAFLLQCLLREYCRQRTNTTPSIMYKWVVTPSASFPRSHANEYVTLPCAGRGSGGADVSQGGRSERDRFNSTWDNREWLEGFVHHDIVDSKGKQKTERMALRRAEPSTTKSHDSGHKARPPKSAACSSDGERGHSALDERGHKRCRLWLEENKSHLASLTHLESKCLKVTNICVLFLSV